MFFTGFSRNSSAINQDFIKKISINSYGLNELHAISYEAMKIFKNDKIDIDKLGYYLNQSWNIKRMLTKSISNSKIENIYKKELNTVL